jgi:hypothetical protein
MAAKTQAQEEFDNIFAPTSTSILKHHPEDKDDVDRPEDRDEETAHQQTKINETMRQPTYDRGLSLRLPPPSFDSGRTTGVKGVIADARNFVQAKKEEAWKALKQPATTANPNGRINGNTLVYTKQAKSEKPQSRTRRGDSYFDPESEDDEEFLEQWREARRKELMKEGKDIRNRRTSPSMRRWGKFDEVDALGYLDAIERVIRDTIVVVFVYDHEVSSASLKPAYPVNIYYSILTITSVRGQPSDRESSQQACASPSTCPFREDQLRRD